jgi:SAM-dependent methyltransferase
MDTKQARERDFHNAAFSDNRRDKVLPAYAIQYGSTQLYRGFIRSHARGARLLEYGCGASAMGSQLGGEAAEVVGIDISEVAVQQATGRAAAMGLNASYHVMDAESLQFPDESFDQICSAAILHNLDLRRAYAEVARTLRAGGSAIFLEPLGHNPAINAFRRLTPSMRTPDEHPLLTPDLELANEYFHSVELRFFSLTTLMAIPLQRLRAFWPVLRWLERVDSVLFDRMRWTRKYAWQVVMVLSQPKRPVPATGQ